jgi:hypothetical protein
MPAVTGDPARARHLLHSDTPSPLRSAPVFFFGAAIPRFSASVRAVPSCPAGRATFKRVPRRKGMIHRGRIIRPVRDRRGRARGDIPRILRGLRRRDGLLRRRMLDVARRNRDERETHAKSHGHSLPRATVAASSARAITKTVNPTAAPTASAQLEVVRLDLQAHWNMPSSPSTILTNSPRLSTRMLEEDIAGPYGASGTSVRDRVLAAMNAHIVVVRTFHARSAGTRKRSNARRRHFSRTRCELGPSNAHSQKTYRALRSCHVLVTLPSVSRHQQSLVCAGHEARPVSIGCCRADCPAVAWDRGRG